MSVFHIKMGENGRIVIPAACRQQLQLEPGEPLTLRIEDGELRIYTLRHAVKKAQALVKRYAKNKNLVNALRQMRDKDEADERRNEGNDGK